MVSMSTSLLYIAGLMKKSRPDQSPQLVDLCKQSGLTSDDIDKEVSDEHTFEFFPLLKRWELVAAHLGLMREDFRYNYFSREAEMGMYMLQDWKKMKSQGIATYKVLLEALIKCKCSESAVQVCRK